MLTKASPRYIEAAWLRREPRPTVMWCRCPLDAASQADRAADGPRTSWPAPSSAPRGWTVAAFERLIASYQAPPLHVRVRLHGIAHVVVVSEDVLVKVTRLARQLSFQLGVLDVAHLIVKNTYLDAVQLVPVAATRVEGSRSPSATLPISARSGDRRRAALAEEMHALACAAPGGRSLSHWSLSATCRGSATKRLPARSACRWGR